MNLQNLFVMQEKLDNHIMDLQLLDGELKNKWYKEGDCHTLYYGKIVKI